VTPIVLTTDKSLSWFNLHNNGCLCSAASDTCGIRAFFAVIYCYDAVDCRYADEL